MSDTDTIRKLQDALNRANQRARTAEARVAALVVRAENAESVVRAHQISIGVIGQIVPCALNQRMERHYLRTGNLNNLKKIHLILKKTKEARSLRQSERLDSKLEKAVEQAKNAEQRAEMAEQRAEMAEQRADRAEAQQAKTEDRIDRAEERADKAEARADRAEAQQAKSQERTDRAEERTHQAEQRAHQAEQRANKAEAALAEQRWAKKK